MSVQSKLLVVAALVVIAFGAYADRAVGDPGGGGAGGQPLCDNKCRMRDQHQFCGTGTCIKFWIRQCVCSAPGNNDLCRDNGDYNPLLPNCDVPLDGPLQIGCDYDDECANLCSCATAYVVEAAMTGNVTHTISFNHDVCRQ